MSTLEQAIIKATNAHAKQMERPHVSSQPTGMY